MDKHLHVNRKTFHHTSHKLLLTYRLLPTALCNGLDFLEIYIENSPSHICCLLRRDNKTHSNNNHTDKLKLSKS